MVNKIPISKAFHGELSKRLSAMSDVENVNSDDDKISNDDGYDAISPVVELVIAMIASKMLTVITELFSTPKLI